MLLLFSYFSVTFQLLLALGADIEYHSFALKIRHIVRLAILSEVSGETCEEQLALFLEDDRASAEEDIGFNLVAFFQELDGMLEFEVVIVVIGLRTESDLLHLLLFLVGLSLFLLFLLCVEEFLVVNHPADRRVSGRSYLDEIKILLIRYFHSLLKRVDALLYVVADEANLCDAANLVIDTMRVFFNNTTTAWSGSNSCYMFNY